MNASLGIISQIAVGGGGTVALGDALAHKIRMVNLQTGVIQGYGTGNAVNAGDFGSFVSASFNQPKGLAMYEEIHPPVVGTGLFLSDPADNVIRRMDANGIMTTVVGPGTPGNLGDGGAGIFATVNNPASLTVFNGALYIADAGNHRIRKYDMTSTIITTVAGNVKVDPEGRLKVLAFVANA